jgi:hypothetical protein
MPTHESLDELIAKMAVEFADQIKAVAAIADKEEEIRIQVERQLGFIEREAGIILEGKHEFTVARGHVDSVYDRVIIEYKNPKSPGDRIGSKLDSPGSQKVVEQIKKRFYDMRFEFGHPLNTLFGVGLDGNYFIFVRFRDDKWQVQEPVEVNRYSSERFLWALFNLGQKGKPISPEFLAGDFGAVEGSVATAGIHSLYNAISNTDHPKALTFLNQWKILFGIVCGYDVESPSEKIIKLADFYSVPVRGVKPAELLFAVHTYYAIFMKLLASEIMAFFHKLPTPHQEMMQASTSNKLKREMEKLEEGGIFHHLNITNFLEGDLFTWYTAIWDEKIEQLIRNMVTKLDNYNPGTLSEDPGGSRDLLKKLYQQLFPKSVRHDLGEYYTPDWLAEHVLNEVGYEGDPDKRLLDPACGSGTFLVLAINRIRKWYDEHRESCQFGEGDLLRKILNNVIGFDLNPLAVMASRTNYLIAIRDLISYGEKVELPVYLCDSVLTPSEYAEEKQDALFAKPMKLLTSAKPTPFLIPREVTSDRSVLAKYTNILTELAPEKSGFTEQDFLERLKDDSLPHTDEGNHTRLFNDLRKLDKDRKNSIWARIIKNAFAPIFIERVDYIAGNPPWVNWENLPEDYRDKMKPLWQHYGLFTLSGSAGRLGGGKKDISMLFVYAAVDNFLKPEGKLGFLITQTVFKTKGAGDGFRRLSYQLDDEKIVLNPIIVHDLSQMQVFEGATNRTAVFVCQKQKQEFTYPVPYISWLGPSRIDQDLDLPSVIRMVAKRELGAIPVNPKEITSPWLTSPVAALPGIKKVLGQSEYKAYEGVNTGGLNGCYWIRILEHVDNKHVLIENLFDVGKIKVDRIQTVIESELVYPLLRGRDVARWHAEPSAHIILVQDPNTRIGIAEDLMKRQFTETFKYLKIFETQLRKRGSSSVRHLMDVGPFYSMFAVGQYTLAPWKVIWRDMGDIIQVAVVGKHEKKVICPEHHVMFISVQSENEAHFICGVLNSSPVQLIVSGYTTTTGMSTHVLENVAIPSHNAKDKRHALISTLSERCHEIAPNGDSEALKELERQIDEIVSQLWGITDDELKKIQSAMNKIRNTPPNEPLEDDSE